MTTDALGSPRIITDGGGNVISRQDFMPFGEEIAANVGGRLTTQGYAGNDGVRQQFTGYERDVESGLDYAQNRYFASKHGRFTSVDPLTASANMKDPQTFNRYSYALNSPYKFIDPLGLSPCGVGTSQTGVGRVCNQSDDVDDDRGTRDDCGAYGERQSGSCRQDDRPNIADMVEDNNGVDTYVFPEENEFWKDIPGRYRFGTGHDGEHVLGSKEGSDVSAIEGLSGTVLGHFNQGENLYTVYIKLKGSDTVLVLKDVINLSPKISKSNVIKKDGTGIFNRKGKILSTTELKPGDKIGQTRKWSDNDLENKSKVGLHFGFVKLANIKDYRINIGKGENSTFTNPEYFVGTPCGVSSPVRC